MLQHFVCKKIAVWNYCHIIFQICIATGVANLLTPFVPFFCHTYSQTNRERERERERKMIISNTKKKQKNDKNIKIDETPAIISNTLCSICAASVCYTGILEASHAWTTVSTFNLPVYVSRTSATSIAVFIFIFFIVYFMTLSKFAKNKKKIKKTETTKHDFNGGDWHIQSQH